MTFICCQIWDVDIYAPVSLFGEHMATPLTVCWCRHDQDMLISGGEDRFLYMWKYTDFSYPGEIRKDVLLLMIRLLNHLYAGRSCKVTKGTREAKDSCG